MDNKQEFAELLTDVLSMYEKTPTPKQMLFWWNALCEYDFESVSKAFTLHAKISEFAPVPASIIKHLPDTSGWLSPEEAWNALPKTEYDGGYVNQGIMTAMGACLDSLDRGDTVAARMAFIERYKQILVEAKMSGERPAWYYSAPSLGSYDQKQQTKQQSLSIARDKKWISLESLNNANKQLNAPIQADNPVLKIIKQQPIGIGSSKTKQGALMVDMRSLK